MKFKPTFSPPPDFKPMRYEPPPTAAKNTYYASPYFFLLTSWIMYGLILTALVSYATLKYDVGMGKWGFFGLGVVSMVGAIMCGAFKEEAGILAIGYHLMILPFGMILAPALQQYNPTVLFHTLYITLGIAATMGMTGIAFPKVYEGLGLPLFIALICLLIVRILQCFIPGMASLTWIDYLSAGLFSLYIGYDMFRAYNDEWTPCNALWYATNLYLDIINLFLSLLNMKSKN